MGKSVINSSLFVRMVRSGLRNLTNNKDYINKLNVFPVPDGDTGTNMNLSMTSGVNEVEKVKDKDMSIIIAAFVRGLLMGARGNSGVILSQLFRGFGSHLESANEITVKDFAYALDAGVKTAYQSVTNPVEGTILTVAKDAAAHAQTLTDETDMIHFFEQVVAEAKASLDRTPDLLPVLKEVGVVDSGGQGLLVIYQGFLAALRGEEIVATEPEASQEANFAEDVHERSVQSYIDIESIEYGYCTEFIVKFDDEKLSNNPFDEAVFREKLTHYGDSLLVASDDTMVKVHIHSETPGEVMTIAQQYGDLTAIDIENMRQQYEDIVAAENEEKNDIIDAGKNGIISVAAGQGMIDMFYSIGASYMIQGGQTMNPSTEDIVQAVAKVNAENVYIFPNNKNIILAANQAAALIEDKNVIVVPSKTIPQGIHAILEFDDSQDLTASIANLEEALTEVKTGSVTFATRDTVINHIAVKKNDYIGLNDETIVTTSASKLETTESLIETLIDEDAEILTIFFGEDVTAEEKTAIESFAETNYGDDLDIEIHDGKQPIYSFVIMVN